MDRHFFGYLFQSNKDVLNPTTGEVLGWRRQDDEGGKVVPPKALTQTKAIDLRQIQRN